MATKVQNPQTMKIVIAGPPHSGKSVFLGGLTECLPRESYFLFRACPDGEGSWTWRSPEAAKYRRKGTFRPELVDWYVKVLATRRPLAPIVLVDIGGRISEENYRILTEGRVDAAIILSGNPEVIPEWKQFLASCGVRVLAEIYSDYNGQEDDPYSSPMRVHHLERGEDVSSRPTIQRVAGLILEEVGYMSSVSSFIRDGVLSISALAQELGKTPVQRTLPNGMIVSQIVWEGSDLVAISRLLHNRSGKLPECVDIDGPAPAWLICALVHELHPRTVRVNSPDGFVPVGCQRPAGAGFGENLEFQVSRREDGWTVVLCQQQDPSIPLDPAKLGEVIPPELPMGSKVILSGRMPNWLAASLAMAYHGKAKAVACFQPGFGSTVAWTHSREVTLGEVIPG